MKEVFDTYKRRTKLYYVLQIVSIITIISIVIGKLAAVQIPIKYSSYFIIMAIIGITTCVMNLFLTSTGLVKMYRKDGELILATDSITLYSVIIPLNQIKEIQLSGGDYRGARASDGSGNQIRFFDKFGHRTECHFIIKSKVQRDILSTIKKEWEDRGDVIVSDSFL